MHLVKQKCWVGVSALFGAYAGSKFPDPVSIDVT